ncbi:MULTISPECIES: hypothetical protein [unclassified Roseateles]|uniref:hypothetical protein n=1 Tax=unclassified Roseateles TaxID=2626991 RepID=UPI000701466F|nr:MULTISPECIES: hypothetical protein [unclassified Roseateles]KQW45662.1 hypothetical protein ASC81_12270 [Pelomonas sp. Root405]KRA72506.1 hypothetical protein ASD88_12270 [Pelomonas sp. Root662]
MRRRELILAAVLGLAALGARAQSCSLVFGQGRNPPLKGGPDWDGLNQRFNAAVSRALDADGRRAVPMTASSVQINPEAAGLELLQQADRLGCATLVETAVFADELDTLVLRLRVYPLLPQLGDGATLVGLRIGAPLFVTQRDLDLKALARLKPELLGQQMAGEYLQHDRR